MTIRNSRRSGGQSPNPNLKNHDHLCFFLDHLCYAVPLGLACFHVTTATAFQLMWPTWLPRVSIQMAWISPSSRRTGSVELSSSTVEPPTRWSVTRQVVLVMLSSSCQVCGCSPSTPTHPRSVDLRRLPCRMDRRRGSPCRGVRLRLGRLGVH
jgi:hypothetical protein